MLLEHWGAESILRTAHCGVTVCAFAAIRNDAAFLGRDRSDDGLALQQGRPACIFHVQSDALRRAPGAPDIDHLLWSVAPRKGGLCVHQHFLDLILGIREDRRVRDEITATHDHSARENKHELCAHSPLPISIAELFRRKRLKISYVTNSNAI